MRLPLPAVAPSALTPPCWMVIQGPTDPQATPRTLLSILSSWSFPVYLYP